MILAHTVPAGSGRRRRAAPISEVRVVAGENFSFDFEVRTLHSADWIVLTVQLRTGEVMGCRWHVDAQPREIAVALRALADDLDRL